MIPKLVLILIGKTQNGHQTQAMLDQAALADNVICKLCQGHAWTICINLCFKSDDAVIRYWACADHHIRVPRRGRTLC